MLVVCVCVCVLSWLGSRSAGHLQVGAVEIGCQIVDPKAFNSFSSHLPAQQHPATTTSGEAVKMASSQSELFIESIKDTQLHSWLLEANLLES